MSVIHVFGMYLGEVKICFKLLEGFQTVTIHGPLLQDLLFTFWRNVSVLAMQRSIKVLT